MKIDHIQLAMPRGEEDKARKFFIQILGMKEELKPKPLDIRGGCWFREDELIIHVGVEDNFRPQKKAHPAILVEDIESLGSTLEENGYPVTWDECLPDRRRFYINDPFGNRIEIIRKNDGFQDR